MDQDLLCLPKHLLTMYTGIPDMYTLYVPMCNKMQQCIYLGIVRVPYPNTEDPKIFEHANTITIEVKRFGEDVQSQSQML